MNTIFTDTPPGIPNSQATHCAARSAALVTALGTTTAAASVVVSVNASPIRVLTEQELQKLKLSKEVGETIETFADKVTDIAKRIQGTEPATYPKDFPMLVYECIQESTTPGLLHKESKGNPKVDDWEANVSKPKLSYRALVNRKGWQASKHHEEKADVQAMQAMISTLQQTVKSLGSSKQSGSGIGGTDPRMCYHCGKKGHVKPNCPDKNKPKAGSAEGSGGSTTPSSGTTAPAANRVAPKEGEPHTKKDSDGAKTKWCGTCNRWWKGETAHLTEEHVKGKGRTMATQDGELHTKKVDGVDCKWCDTCKQWNKGEKAHLTEEHVKGKGKTTAPQAAGAFTTIDDNDTGAALRLVSGFMDKRSMLFKCDERHYCGNCMIVVPRGERCTETPLHLANEGKWALVGLQCKCGEKCDKANEWIQITYKKIGFLKDQAGHP